MTEMYALSIVKSCITIYIYLYIFLSNFPFLLKALQVITHAVSLHGDDADLYYHQGNLYKDLKNMQQAKEVRVTTCATCLNTPF